MVRPLSSASSCARGGGGDGGRELSVSCGAFRRRRFFGGGDRSVGERRDRSAPGKMGGHRKPTLGRTGFHRRADRSDAASDAAPIEGRTGGPRREGLAQRGMAVPAPRGAELQKKRCSPLSRDVKTSPAGVGDGAPGRAHRSRRLVFIDETWMKTNMAPLRSRWGPKENACASFAPYGHWRTLTFLGALRCNRLAAPCVFNGPINGECFRAYVEQQLAPILRPGDIVVMDNLGSHKSSAVRRHPRRWRWALVSPPPLARPQSDRADLRQDQTVDAPSAERERSRCLAPSDASLKPSTASAQTTSQMPATVQSKRETL